MSTKVTNWILGVVPAVLAFAAVYFEQAISAYARGRSAVLPLATLLLLSILLHPRLRYLLMITLCYGVSFLALRDVLFRSVPGLPPPLNYLEWEALKVIDLLIVAGLSATAALTETLRPGTVWARRCYFGAAGLYFFGMGLVSYFRFMSWQSLLLAVTGITALMGCVFAHRIVSTEAEEVIEEDVATDEMLQQAHEAAHRAALHAKEWRDNLVAAIDECDTPSGPVASG